MSYKRWVLVAILLFGIGLVFGLSTPLDFASLVFEDITALEELGGFLASLPSPLATAFIFANNALVLVISFVLSPIFCLIPILALTINGWLLAFVSVMASQEASLGLVLAALLPHGVFELPALIMGEAVALSFGVVVILALFKKERRSRLLPSLKQHLKYLIIALVLFIPAAVIEIYVTPIVMKLMV